MLETRFKKNKEVIAQGESTFHNRETNNSSIPLETRAHGNNGEPIHHGHEESVGETSSRDDSSLSSTGRGLIQQMYGKFTEVVKNLLFEARESQRQQFDSNYRTLAHEFDIVFTNILQRISEENRDINSRKTGITIYRPSLLKITCNFFKIFDKLPLCIFTHSLSLLL